MTFRLLSLFLFSALYQFNGHAQSASAAAERLRPPAKSLSQSPSYPLQLWRDPAFALRFMGSYGIIPDAEPPLKEADKAILQRIAPLMGEKPAEAVSELLKVITKDSNANFEFNLANLYFQQNQFPEAEKYYLIAVQKYPNFRRGWRALGWTAVRLNDFPKAVKALSTAITLGNNEGTTYGLYAFALLSMDRTISAESAYRMALMFEPDSLDWKMGLIRCVLKQEKAAEAAALCAELIQQYPDKPEFLVLQANAFIAMKETMRAAENLEIVARSGAAKKDDLKLLGDVYFSEKRSALALSAWTRAMDADDGKDTAGPVRQAENLAALDARTDAATLIAKIFSDRADKLPSGDREKLLKLQARLALADGRNEEALRVLEEVVLSNPLDGSAMMQLGDYYMGNAEPQRAISYFERASKLSDKDLQSTARVRMGRILFEEGKAVEALQMLKTANEIKPSESVQKFIMDLEKYVRRNPSKS